MALEAPEKNNAGPSKQLRYGLGIAILLIALIPSIYFYTQYQSAQQRLNNPNLFAQEEAKKLVESVGSLMTLPSGETPTVATVNDKEKLKNQPFFANAENGDKVLIYTNAKKAILFRPSINKIIDVAPVNIGAAASGSAQVAGAETTPAPTPIKFLLRNGTSVVGLTKKFETTLTAKVKNAQVVDRDNAKKKDYDKSLIVDVKGDNGPEASQLAQTLGLTVSSLPAGEATPTADFLIILGADVK